MGKRWAWTLAAAWVLAGAGLAQERGAGKRVERPDRFERLDANGDGVLTRGELPARAQRRLDLLERFGRSGDGGIQREDVERFRGARKQVRQQAQLGQRRGERFGALRELRRTNPELARELLQLRRQMRELRLQRERAPQRNTLPRRNPEHPRRSI